MPSLEYINEKISDAVYLLTVDEGDACTRLARVYTKLSLLPDEPFPEEVRKDWIWVKTQLERGDQRINKEREPARLTGIRNTTARKVIEKLVKIQDTISHMTWDD